MACEPISEVTTLRVATYNTHLARGEAGAALAEIEAGSEAVDAVISVIAEAQPDILLINELDYEAEGDALAAFRTRLSERGVDFAFAYTAPVNTGVRSGFDLNGDGKDYGPADAFGWGVFPGQFGMALLSKLPLDEAHIRTFRLTRWADMPGNLMPPDYYPPEAEPALRLSSKSHWDVPVILPSGARVHLLASHPTPPVFDGPENRNGRRNHDEIRFWVDYIDRSDWIKDDEGARGGLEADASFVVLGDLNNDPNDGDGHVDAIRALLSHSRIIDPEPKGTRTDFGAGVNEIQVGDPRLDTADWRDRGDTAAGDLRVDYVLPSRDFEVVDAGVIWPAQGSALREVVEKASDHRLVWVDLREKSED